MVEAIQNNRDQQHYTCSVIFDLEKAFDICIVKHDILVRKLEYYGTMQINIMSCDLQCSTSMRDPLLFLLYINDIHVSLKRTLVHHFDDTNLLYSDKSIKNLRKNMNHEMKRILL